MAKYSINATIANNTYTGGVTFISVIWSHQSSTDWFIIYWGNIWLRFCIWALISILKRLTIYLLFLTYLVVKEVVFELFLRCWQAFFDELVVRISFSRVNLDFCCEPLVYIICPFLILIKEIFIWLCSMRSLLLVCHDSTSIGVCSLHYLQLLLCKSL